MQCIALSYGQVKGKAKQYPYHQPALYESVARRDGVRTYRHVRHLGMARRSIRLALLDAEIQALVLGVPVVHGIRHGVEAIGPEPRV